MLEIITLNVNGLRSASQKGFWEWMLISGADFVCLQEVRLQAEHLTPLVLAPGGGYQGFFHLAEKKGYSGVAIYARRPPDRVQAGIGWLPMDQEGRFLQLDYGRLSLISLYLPSGSSGEERQQFKYEVLAYLESWLQAKRQDGREYVLCGDWNIAHQPIDLKNWRGNLKNSGFLPEERAWMSQLFEKIGFVDVFRRLNPHPEQYTWWSNRGQAWAKNVGWRIDYQITTPRLGELARQESIYKAQRFSDHAPLTISYDWPDWPS